MIGLHICKACLHHIKMIPNGVVRRYTLHFCISRFAASFKFEFSKKRLNYLNFEMIRRICLILIDDWMETGGGSLAAPGPQDADDESISEPSLDKDFLTSLRELKVFKICWQFLY